MPKCYGKTGNPEQRAELAAKAFAMRLKGETNVTIGKELGVSRETVRTLLSEYRAGLVTPLAEEARNVELEKLNMLEAVAWKLLEDNHVAFQHGKVIVLKDPETGAERTLKDTEPIFKAIDRVLKISERRAKYLGLDMPTKSEHTVTTSSVVDDSILALVAQMEEQNQEDREQSA